MWSMLPCNFSQAASGQSLKDHGVRPQGITCEGFLRPVGDDEGPESTEKRFLKSIIIVSSPGVVSTGLYLQVWVLAQ